MRSIPIDAAPYTDAVIPEGLTEVMVPNRKSPIQSVVADSLIAFAIRDNAPGDRDFDSKLSCGSAQLTGRATPSRPIAGSLKPRVPGQARHKRTFDEHFTMPEIGKLFVIIGAFIVVLGIILWSGVGAGFLGKLPGDIRIERGNSVFYFPIVTCIIISIVLSLIFSLFRR